MNNNKIIYDPKQSIVPEQAELSSTLTLKNSEISKYIKTLKKIATEPYDLVVFVKNFELDKPMEVQAVEYDIDYGQKSDRSVFIVDTKGVNFRCTVSLHERVTLYPFNHLADAITDGKNIYYNDDDCELKTSEEVETEALQKLKDAFAKTAIQQKEFAQEYLRLVELVNHCKKHHHDV